MQQLIHKSDLLIASVPVKHRRSVQGKMNPSWRLNGIYGARGVGKTTLLLQIAKEKKQVGKEVLYVRLDDLYFAQNSLYELADAFRKDGGEYLFLDEVHKYDNWSRELKNIYDSMPGLNVTFSGSSIIELSRNEADLSRRALMYFMPGLSFREYLLLSGIIEIPIMNLNDILKPTQTLASEISATVPIIKHFKQYLQSGFYPFFLEEHRDYLLTLEQVIRTVIEVDFQHIKHFDASKNTQILSLLRIVAASAPFIPNISKIAEKTQLHRQTVLLYLTYLEKAGLIKLINRSHKSISRLQKPDKLFLDNPNLFYALNPENINKGSLRETFAVNQLSVNHEVTLHPRADFIVDDTYVFEIGGKSKTQGQISEEKRAFLLLDDTETAYKNRIPLWMIGFLY